MTIRKTNRKGLTKAKWVEVIQSLLKTAGIENPKIEFTPDGINVEWFTIVPVDYEKEDSWAGCGKIIVRGYEVIEWRSTGYSYHEPEATRTPRRRMSSGRYFLRRL